MTNGFKKVHDVLENYKSAVYEKDIERFLSIYASDIHIFDCWGSWEISGIFQWRGTVIEWFNGLREEGILLKVNFNDLVIEESSNIAFVYSAVTFAAQNQNSGEILRQMTNRFTLGLRKENESWAITHEHSSLPINMETGKGLFNLK